MNFDVIYADPPWKYNFSSTESRSIENQYPTMNIEEICQLKIPAADNAVLFLWATSPKLPEALSVISAWGFTYKSHMIWDKSLIGMGYWFRGQHELLLVATRGKFSPPAQELRISSVYKETRTKHSKKPNYVRNMIALWYPGKTKVELFAREKHDGWNSWGNEIVSDIEVSK